MGLRYQKRLNLGKGVGLNVSKSGISGSYRSKMGSIGSRGFTIKSGIPGLSYRGAFGKSTKGAEVVVLLIAAIAFGAIYLTGWLLWHMLMLLQWGVAELYCLIRRILERR